MGRGLFTSRPYRIAKAVLAALTLVGLIGLFAFGFYRALRPSPLELAPPVQPVCSKYSWTCEVRR